MNFSSEAIVAAGLTKWFGDEGTRVTAVDHADVAGVSGFSRRRAQRTAA